MISPMASSATERLFECGSLKTAMPRSLEAARSILSTPMQNAPTATSSGAASSTAAEMRVFERAPKIEAPRIFCTSSASPSAPFSDSTSKPASSNCEAATPLMFSSSKTFKHPPRKTVVPATRSASNRSCRPAVRRASASAATPTSRLPIHLSSCRNYNGAVCDPRQRHR